MTGLLIGAYALVAAACVVVMSLALAQGKPVSMDDVALALFVGICWPILLPFVALSAGIAWILRAIQRVTS